MSANITTIEKDYIVDMSSNNNFIQIPSIQGDGNYVRYVKLLLVANNMPYELPEDKVGIYVVGTKPDTKHILNNCEIEDGKIKFEITSQMAAVEGRGDYQIMIIDTETNSQIKSFPFYLITTKSYDAGEILSSDEYQALSQALADMQSDIDRCEENANLAVASAEAALVSENNAKDSENASKASEEAALASEQASKASELAAKASEDAAKISEDNAKESEINAKASEEYMRTFISQIDGETLLLL